MSDNPLPQAGQHQNTPSDVLPGYPCGFLVRCSWYVSTRALSPHVSEREAEGRCPHDHTVQVDASFRAPSPSSQCWRLGGASGQRQRQSGVRYPSRTGRGPLSVNSNLLSIPADLPSQSLYKAKGGPQAIGTTNSQEGASCKRNPQDWDREVLGSVGFCLDLHMTLSKRYLLAPVCSVGSGPKEPKKPGSP